MAGRLMSAVLAGALTVSSVGLAACTDDENSDASTPVVISIPASTDAPLAGETLPGTEATAQTEPPGRPSPDTAPVDTGRPTDEGFDLRADGVGDLPFGAAPEVVVDALSPTFGAAPEVTDFDFSDDQGGGVALTADGAFGFVHRLGRSICWTAFCAYFGSDAGAPLAFVGWSYRPDTEPYVALYTASGITVGSRWSDHLGEIDAPPGGCGEFGFGTTTDGVDLGLRGGVWTEGGVSDPLVELLPDPTTVTVAVYRMEAGDVVFPSEADC